MTKNVASLIKILGSKWTLMIVVELFSGTKRFGELQRALDRISPKVLSLRLKELEEEGIVRKEILPVLPAHVEYSLTAKGRSLKVIIQKMFELGSETTTEMNETFVTPPVH